MVIIPVFLFPVRLTRWRWRIRFGFTLGVALCTSLPAQAQSGNPHPPTALALLEQHCVPCHGGAKTKAGLDLTTHAALLRGGESGAAVVLGRPELSLFQRMITHEEEPGMPHKKDKLPEAEIAIIAAWIRDGAIYTRELRQTEIAADGASPTRAAFALTEADRSHWAFQPVVRPKLPVVKQAAWPRSPLDTFILAELEAKGRNPAVPTDREVLIRRVTLDLVGLPPTLAEIDAFVRDASPRAYETLVDRLLASPHYGERWGRHWLDLARFAESDGFEHDAARPNAWRYRDYVVRALNADKPYDRFIREQLAGDELFPGDPDAQIATAFNLLGPDMVDSADQVQRRRNTLNDMTDTTALALLGLTVGCARCHDHKFEPIAQRDYYRLQAFFAATKFRYDLPVPTAAESRAHETALATYGEQTQAVQTQIFALEEPQRKALFERKLAKLSPEAQAAHGVPKEQRTTEQENLVLETAHLVAVAAKEIGAAMKKPDRDRHAVLLAELKPFPKPRPLSATLALQNGAPAKTHVLHRGDYNQPGDEVRAGFPQVLSRGGAAASEVEENVRAPLAHWVASEAHPLTARVMVNRIWQHHFGRGLVGTPSDFGTHGQKPTHPALLEWLAAEFTGQGWSLKAMHRLMLLSATYQQASTVAAAEVVRDPENRLYGRMNRLRIEGEVIRDCLLAISGELNLEVGGPGVFPPIPKDLFEGAKGWIASTDPREHTRRSLYIFARRNLRFPFLEVFDAPDNNLSCSARERSTTAPQSLTLLNAEEVLAAAARTAERLTAAADSPEGRVTLAYRLIIGRPPTAMERRLSVEFLARSPLSELCRGLFNLNAFVYVD